MNEEWMVEVCGRIGEEEMDGVEEEEERSIRR